MGTEGWVLLSEPTVLVLDLCLQFGGSLLGFVQGEVGWLDGVRLVDDGKPAHRLPDRKQPARVKVLPNKALALLFVFWFFTQECGTLEGRLLLTA